jgi:hypothetical protein
MKPTLNPPRRLRDIGRYSGVLLASLVDTASEIVDRASQKLSRRAKCRDQRAAIRKKELARTA